MTVAYPHGSCVISFVSVRISSRDSNKLKSALRKIRKKSKMR